MTRISINKNLTTIYPKKKTIAMQMGLPCYIKL